LGSGYKIATSDLNLRGAGSVLGYKQSGQASRVGLEYYNDLLKEAINKKLYEVDKKNIVDVVFFGKALITKRYVSNEIERLSFYTRINKANKEEELKELREELLDRFGKLPAETNSFIDLAVIKLFYKKTLIRSITINKDSVVFELGGKKTTEKIINKILAYKNTVVLNKKFKEGRSGFFVVFNVVVGFSWCGLLLNCYTLFSDS
jgi:transcription-repair coupling factor (superfamily II helicase)